MDIATASQLEISSNFLTKNSDNEELNSPEELNNYAFKAQRFIEEDKVYLNQCISLFLMADALNIAPYKLSHALTYHFGKNYNDIINSYRIEHAKKMLLNPTFAFYSIDGIGNESGFGNKVTFYSAFKKHTGTTPAMFRKKFMN